MDKSMKLMFGVMTIAITLMAFNMMSNNSSEAHASAYLGDGGRGGVEPTIVSFRVTPIGADRHTNAGSGYNWANNPTGILVLTRMWSDGTVEMNVVGDETLPDTGTSISQVDLFSDAEFFTGWQLVKDSVAGYRCAGDTDGNRQVAIEDLLAVIDDYGPCEGEPPLGIPMDMDP